MSRLFWFSLCVMFTSIKADGWIRTYGQGYGDGGYAVTCSNDGGFVIGGQQDSTGEYCNLWLIKADSMGDTLWTRIFDSGGEDRASCVIQTKEGDYVVTGHLGVEPCLIRVKPYGDTAWIHTYGYGGANWVEQTSDGGFILTGRIEDAYLWILKTDNNGDTLWSKWYQWGTFSENGNCIRQTFDGGYIVATNMGLLKTDDKGDSVWMQPWISKCVEQTTDSGYILATQHNGDIWLIKTDWKGDTLWTKTYGGKKGETAYAVHQTKDGGYIIIGNTESFMDTIYSDVWLVKTDVNGDTLWTRAIGGSRFDEVYSGQQTMDGGFIMTGWGASYGGGVLLIKTDSLGYVGVEEPVTKPAQTAWQVVSAIGSTVTLRYTNLPKGFHALVFDASGRRVDEIQAQGESGTITWGQGKNPGVYFIKTNSPNSLTEKVVLLK